jgi:hypothetical protein
MIRTCPEEKTTAQRRKGLPVRVWKIERQSKTTKSKRLRQGTKSISPVAGQIFMRVDEVTFELGVPRPYAYKLIKKMNEELNQTGCITIPGRIDRNFFYEKFDMLLIK